jgi:hypothetical protein
VLIASDARNEIFPAAFDDVKRHDVFIVEPRKTFLLFVCVNYFRDIFQGNLSRPDGTTTVFANFFRVGVFTTNAK